MISHEEYMLLALELAKEAGNSGEAPVGCIVIDATGAIVGCGRNRRETQKNAIAHAELEAISEACKAVGDWRLTECSLYVTLEPCPMCAGAIIMSRIDTVYYGAKDKITGSCGSVFNLFMEPFGASTKIIGGILEDACSQHMTAFFRKLR